MMELTKFEDLKGVILEGVENKGGEELVFTLIGGDKYKLYHYQDCCENVTIEDIDGPLDVLIETPILIADESSNSEYETERCYESCTWTFYRLVTAKGGVTIRWFGVSNGYYSENVDFIRVV